MKKQSCLIMVTLPVELHAELKAITEKFYGLSMSRLARELLTEYVDKRKARTKDGSCCFSYAGVNYCDEGVHYKQSANPGHRSSASKPPIVA